MASTPTQRPRKGDSPPSWRVQWRFGGKQQSVTLPTKRLAESAQRLAEARAHQVTDAEVYAAVLGLEQDGIASARPPTLAEFAAGWITDQRETGDVQDDYLDKTYRALSWRCGTCTRWSRPSTRQPRLLVRPRTS